MKVHVLIAAAALVLGTAYAKADVIPYPNAGTPIASTTLTATVTGFIDAYFYGSDAGHQDLVMVMDVNSGVNSGWIFDNHATTPGTSMLNALAVTAGDTLEILLWDVTSGNIWSSIAGENSDQVSHAYNTPFSGGMVNTTNVPAGTFIGMEDLTFASGSDWDYNDDQFVFTNMGTTPEPGSLLLLGTGLAALANYVRRKRLN